MTSELPPNYTVQDSAGSSGTTAAAAPQIVITPLPNEVQFQSGNLGADGEPAAVEGEVQLKGLNSNEWDRLVITLRTTETIPSQKVELGSFEVVLWSRTEHSTSGPARPLPSNVPFSIPLLPDAPQSINTPTSSLTHTLTATLFPITSTKLAMKKVVPIQIRRFSQPWNPALHPAPTLLTLEDPVPLIVQTPRSAFRAGEMIPLYFTVPPPSPSVFNQGIQLRNITAELVRLVEIGPVNVAEEVTASSPTAGGSSMPWSGGSGGSSHCDYPPEKTALPPVPVPASVAKPTTGHVHETVITRSGASCRLNPNRAVQLRLVLHSSTQSDLDMENEAVPPEVDTAAGSITQSTILHRVSFYIQVHVTFLSQTDHTAKAVQGLIPIVIVPGLAPQVDVQAEYEQSYMKKHDRPPARTARTMDDGISQPPPFDDAGDGLRTPGLGVGPPPFTAEPVTSVGSELPSFSESQAAASASGSRFIPPSTATLLGGFVSSAQNPRDSAGELRFEGEGVAFGFKPEDQYDGLSHSLMMSPDGRQTPPPTVSSSVHDANVTALAELITHERRMDPNDGGPRPPPPPALDDPMDLPPTIDESFRLMDPPVGVGPGNHHLPAPSGPPPQLPVDHAAHATPPGGVEGGPPPYLGATGGVPSAPPAYLDSH